MAPPPLPSDTSGTFTFGERLGLVFVAEMAFVSFLAVGFLLVLIIVKATNSWRSGRLQWPSSIHVFFFSLLFADLVQALGAIMDIKWIHVAGVIEGPYCNAQGLFKQAGDVGVALSNLAIAVQTFRLLVLRTRISEKPQFVLIPLGLIWGFICCITAIPWAVHHHRGEIEPYYGNTQWWCWIRRHYLGLGVGLEYAWMWFAALASFILYVPLAVILYRRDIVRYHGHQSSKSGQNDNVQKVALQMLFYPVIYTITVLPISIFRFLQFNNQTVPFEWTAFGGVVLASSGTFNVLLFYITRPALIPTRKTQDTDTVRTGTLRITPISPTKDHDRNQLDSFAFADVPMRRLSTIYSANGDSSPPSWREGKSTKGKGYGGFEDE